MIPLASLDLLGYKTWRASLKPLPLGTVLVWKAPWVGVSQADNIKVNQHFEVVEVQSPRGRNKEEASRVYCLNQVSQSGKRFNRQMYFSVENIARYIDDGTVVTK